MPLVDLAVGSGFSLRAWPLHVTVVSNFTTSLPAHAIGHLLAPVIEDSGTITASVGSETLFGRNFNVRVNLVDENPGIRRLHERMLDALDNTDGVYHDPGFLHAGFRPHVTATKLGRVSPGDSLVLRQVALVDMAPAAGSSHRLVVWTAPLG